MSGKNIKDIRRHSFINSSEVLYRIDINTPKHLENFQWQNYIYIFLGKFVDKYMCTCALHERVCFILRKSGFQTYFLESIFMKMKHMLRCPA